jgi:hypothetical protein
VFDHAGQHFLYFCGVMLRGVLVASRILGHNSLLALLGAGKS